MAFKTTRDQRAQRWRIVRSLIRSNRRRFHLQFCLRRRVDGPGQGAQQEPSQRRRQRRPPDDDVQPFAIGTDGSVAEQLISLKIDPADAQAAADAVAKALGQLDPRPPAPAARSCNRRAPASPSAWSRCSSIPPSRSPSNCTAAPTAATATSWRPAPPKATTSASPAVPSTTLRRRPRAPARWSPAPVSVVKASGSTSGRQPGADRRQRSDPQGTDPGAGAASRPRQRQGRGPARAAPSTARRAFCSPASAKARASSPSGGSRRPTSRKAGSTNRAAAWAARRWPSRKPDARISSPFGTRRYYGRSTGGGFHNGIDFEGKIGEPIYRRGRRRDQPPGLVLQLRPHGEDQPRRQFRDALRPHVALRRRHGPGQPASARAT